MVIYIYVKNLTILLIYNFIYILGKADINFEHWYYKLIKKTEDDCHLIFKEKDRYEIPLL